MASMTHREYLTRLAWLNMEWEKPSLSDHYLMQIAQEVRRVLSKKPKNIKLDDFEIKWVPKKTLEQTKKEKEAAVKSSKRSWFRALGISGK